MEVEPECMCLSDLGGEQRMKERITLSLDKKLVWFLRHKQAEMILELNQPVSISYVARHILNKAIKDESMINSELDSTFVRPNGMHSQAGKI